MVFDPRWVMPPGGHGQMRTSTADRESAIEILKTGFAEGRLTQEEYGERVGLAYGSRTYDELARITWDLPAPGQVTGLVRQPSDVRAFPAQRQLNGLAVSSVVLAFFPGLLSMLAVVLGLAARTQIRERGGRGAGVAALGITIGALSSLFFLLWMLGLGQR
jgi:Domain of unknown function (DUF1707)/Domain of unknown function (DUF4190)